MIFNRMGDVRRVRCVRCHRHVTEVGEVSWAGLCDDCAIAAVYSNVEQMLARRGPNFAKWRASMAACVGGVLLDDVQAEP